MELLHPQQPLHLDGLSSPTETVQVVNGVQGQSSEKVYIAVGVNIDKALTLLQWSFNQFGGCEFCLLHVHKPSPVIPTLMGKLPVSQANSELVNAYREEEKEKLRKHLDFYLAVCAGAKVKASVFITEADYVPGGIIELVNQHCIKKLVMGDVPARCLKMRSSRKVDYASRKAPPFCEMWFVIKGKHAWAREAFEGREVSSARSFRLSKSFLSLALGSLRSRSYRPRFSSELSSRVEADQIDTKVQMFSSLQCDLSSNKSGVCGSVFISEERRQLSSDSDSGFFNETRTDGEISKHNEAFWEELNCKTLELKVNEALNKAQDFESAQAHQRNFRENAEGELSSIINRQEKLLEEKEELSRRQQRTTGSIALLNWHIQGSSRQCKEVSAELNFMESSIAELRAEKQKIQRQRLEAKCWVERWKNAGPLNCNEFVGISDEGMLELAEFSLQELESATFCFSERFKQRQGGNNEIIYKGELMGRTVAIKRLHAHNMQLQQEFQQEIRVLSKVQHPHLVTLFGYCPEVWSLVYEYLPNGNLQDQLFRKTNTSPLSWMARTRIIAEISSALCFLHSIKPERILHGDLKPENILLDSKLTSKICDLGICRLVFNEEANGRSFPYIDPEFSRFGILTTKSDTYSFGIIILQMLTGKPPVGLVGQVQKALSLGKLSSILDTKAGEWPIFVAEKFAKVGLQCCEPNSKDRPDLTPSLVWDLKQLHVQKERAVPSFYLCPIRQDIMHDPQIAEDGFTYEGEAIQSWFRNGHETSPMTNLKLSHLNLTPNHSLRLAIQDWLCKS